MSVLFTAAAEAEEVRPRAAELPRPFDAHRRRVLGALPATRVAGPGLAARMANYQLGLGEDLDTASGKLLRPALCLWACELAGGTADDAMPAALAVEWIHNFTLVHDDIQDGDRVRRHRPSVWAVWGLEQGINGGDALFARAFEIAASSGQAHPQRSLAAVRMLASATRRVIAGQCLDLAQEGRPETSPRAYLRMARLKTGALMGAALAAGAVLGGNPAIASRLSRAGELLGLAFQLRDDWLGLWGEADRTGKPHGDLARRKVTYPVVAAYAAGTAAQKRVLAQLFDARGGDSTQQLRVLLEDLGGPALGGDLADRLAGKAVAAVERLGQPARAAEFAELAGRLAGRTS